MVDVLTAIVLGTLFLTVLSGSHSLDSLLFFILMSLISYKIVAISNFTRSLLLLKTILYYPKALFESILLVLNAKRKRIIENLDVHDEWEELVKTLVITMTPKSLVIDSEEGYITIHKVV